MKIGFPCDSNGRGGVRTWIKTFSDYCINKGHEVFYSHDCNVDVFITIANLSKKSQLEKLKKNGAKIIMRMDGIFYDYFVYNNQCANLLNLDIVEKIYYSDLVIYQSDFSKKVVENILGNKKVKSTVIYNGIDTNLFTPVGEVVPKDNEKKLILSMAYWGTPKMAEFSIITIVNLAKALQSKKEFEFWILGEAYKETEEIIKRANLSNITKYDLKHPIPHELVPKYLRTADLVLHTRPNDACSNFILEALNVNKPIVGLNSGSTPELLKDCGRLANCSNDTTKLPVVDIEDFACQVIKTFEDYDFYKSKVIEKSKLYTQDLMSKRYLDEIKNLIDEGK